MLAATLVLAGCAVGGGAVCEVDLARTESWRVMPAAHRTGTDGSQTKPHTRPHHDHQPSDETDDATADHPFDQMDYWIEVFDDPGRDRWQMPQAVMRALELKAGMRVADIGAGTGYFNPHLAAAVRPEGRVYAIDTEPKMVEHMKERAIAEKTPNVIPILAAPEDPKIPEEGVDVVLIVDTYHHIDDRLQYFERLKGSLKPGGRLVVIDFFKKPLPVGPSPDHKLPREHVLRELEKIGYRLLDERTFLPFQYFLIFEPS
jgi:ubiquinone/menaquinone biosynthesis C-methylase UbiE